MRSVNLTPGTWVIYGFARRATGQFIYEFGIAFSTAQNNVTNETGRKATIQQQGSMVNACWGSTTLVTVSPTVNTTYYLNVRWASNSVGTISLSRIIAVRIA
jgi:hypothetical protein